MATAKSQAQHEAENLKEKEKFANARSLVKHEVENLRCQETFVIKRSLVKHEVEDLQQEEAIPAARLRADHEVEDLQHEKTFSMCTSQKKHEQKDVQNKEKPASTRSRVEDKVEDLQYEDTVAIAIPKVKPKELQHEELQHKQTRVEFETNNLLDKEAVARTRSQIGNKAKDLFDEKKLATLTPNIKNRLKKLKDKVANANVGLRDKHEAGKSLNKEESTATTKTKDKPNEKTPGTAEKREQQVTNLHQDVTHPLSKTSVESEVKSEPAREKHKLKDVQPQISITKKQKGETFKGTTNSIDFSADNLRSNLETTQNADNANVMAKPKVAKTSQNSSLVKTVSAPVPVKNVPVARQKPVETKPSKPLTMEGLYYTVIINVSLVDFKLNYLEKTISPF